MHALPLSWRPGIGGLVAHVPEALLPPLLHEAPAPHACRVRPLHVTLLRTAGMAPLVPVLGPEAAALCARLPGVPASVLLPSLHRASRPPHPVKDPAGSTVPRTTWFVVPADPARLRRALADIVLALDAASRARGGPAFPHPEPRRFFHVSVFNNRGGDAWRSIGDIGPEDLRTL